MYVNSYSYDFAMMCVYGQLTDKTVLVNHATNGHGGAIYSEAVKHIEAEASEIRENSAGGAGGAFSVHDLEEVPSLDAEM